MRKGIMGLATESIAFQNGQLFKDLTEDFVAWRKFAGEEQSDDDFFNGPQAKKVLETIKKATGITMHIVNGEDTGPAMMMPTLSMNHIFYSNEIKEAVRDGWMEGDGYEDIRNIMKSMEMNVVRGEVDLRASRVGGVFCDLDIALYLPKSIISKRSLMSEAEVAAITLHELGHAFTSMEFLIRTVTTNQVLAALVRGSDKTVPSDKRETIFAKGADILKMSKAQREALLNAKSQKEVSMIVLDTAVQTSVSELGASIYDVNACEQLADQFATRHGAGRELVTALDKFTQYSGWTKRTIGYYLSAVIGAVFVICTLLFLTIATWGLIWLVLVYGVLTSPDKNNEIYDNTKSRFLRIKHQNTERLKNRDISNEEKKRLIADNQTIDQVAKYYDDNLNFIEKISYFFSPTYRNAHKYELLQKEIEKLAHNDLFDAAAKLSTI